MRSSASPGIVATKNENIATIASTMVVATKLNGVGGRGAQERIHERGLGTHQEDADRDQHGDIGEQSDSGASR